MQIHREDKTIHLKIVYHGVGLGGKTTNLHQIFNRVRPEQKLSQEIMEIPTQEDKTLTFDIMPLTIGSIRGYTAQFSFYTVPGQVHYINSRRLILEDVDGVVFVADSQPAMREENKRMLAELKGFLKQMNYSDVALALQFNKRDLPNVMSVELMAQDLLENDEPYFEASAISGTGVMETMQTIVQMTIANHYPSK